MKLLFLTPGYPPVNRSGIATYVGAAARGLVQRGHRVHVLTCETDGGPSDSDDMGVQVHRRPVRHIPGVRRALGRIGAQWLQDRLPQQAMTRPGRRIGLGITSLLEASALGVDFDLVESADYFAAGWAIALTRRWPVLTVFHSPLAVEARYSDLPDRAYLRAAVQCERISAELSFATSAPSRLIREELTTMGWKSAAVASIAPIGIDVTEIRSSTADPVRGRVVIAGHVNRRKGHDILARAAAHAAPSVPNLEVVSVGSTGGSGSHNGIPFDWFLRSEIERLGIRWRFVDHLPRPSLIELLSSAQLVVVPSRFESFSLAGLEAMLTARPVVASDRTGLAERCASDPASGLTVVPTGDSTALGEAIIELLNDPHAGVEQGRRARDTALRVGDMDRLLPDREELYGSLVTTR